MLQLKTVQAIDQGHCFADCDAKNSNIKVKAHKGGDLGGFGELGAAMMELKKKIYETISDPNCRENCGGVNIALNQAYSSQQAETYALVQALLAYENAMGGRNNF